MIERIEIRHLRYFVAVAEELHFGRAARRLGISQPPLSLQIRQLELEIGVRLFERTNRRVSLTDAGNALLAESRRFLREFDGLAESTRRAARGETGSLSVAFSGSVMFRALPLIVRRIRQALPRVHVELHEIPTGAQLVALRTGKLDVGFVREPPPDHHLRFETVMKEPLFLAINRAHPLAKRDAVTLRDVADDDWVLFPHDVTPGFHTQVLAICHDAGINPRIVQMSRELYTTVSLVHAGLGVTIVPACARQMGWRGVRYYPIESRLAMTRIAAAWRADNENPTLAAFLDIARGIVGPSSSASAARVAAD